MPFNLFILILLALIIVSAKWERCGEPNLGANLMFALELKTFANNCTMGEHKVRPYIVAEMMIKAILF